MPSYQSHFPLLHALSAIPPTSPAPSLAHRYATITLLPKRHRLRLLPRLPPPSSTVATLVDLPTLIAHCGPTPPLHLVYFGPCHGPVPLQHSHLHLPHPLQPVYAPCPTLLWSVFATAVIIL
jgi:hypothetical protein